MSLRCPVCRADNAAGPACRRCRADLSLLFRLEAQRSRLLAEATRAALRGDWTTAAEHAGRAHGLRRDGDTWRLLAVCAAARGDFAAAYRWYNGAVGGNRVNPATG